MKNFLTLLILAAIMASCSSSNDVVNNGLFQKRKHRTGYHINGLAHAKGSKSSITKNDLSIEMQIPFDDSVDQEEFEITQETQSKQETEYIEIRNESKREFKSVLKAFKKENRAIEIKNKEIASSIIENDLNESLDDTDPFRTAGILSLVFAGLSNILLQLPIVNLVFSGLAIYFGRKARNSDDEDVRTMGQIGSIIGIVTGILGILYILAIAAYILFVFLLIGF